MKLTATYLDSWSFPSFTMAIYISYKETLFEQAKITPIRGEPNLKTLHKLQNEIKAKVKDVYSNIGGGAHVHIGLVFANVQCALISNMPFI